MRSDLLMCDKDLEGGDEVSHGDARVRLPLLVLLAVVNEDEEIIVLALVVDLDLGSLAASHDCCFS